MVVTDFKYTITEQVSDSDMKSNRKRLVEQSQLESCSLVLRSFHSSNSFLNLSLSLAHTKKKGGPVEKLVKKMTHQALVLARPARDN